VAIDPSGTFLYVTTRGLSSVSAYTRDATSGALSPVAGSPFPAGSLPSVIVIAVGNVTDVTPPVVAVPSNITVEATSPAGVTVTFAASANDPDDPAGPVTCSSTSGSTFPIGTTTVACSSTDTYGNTGTASFTVTVLSPAQIVAKLMTAVASLNFQQGSNLLRNVLRALNNGQFGAACNQMGAFINQVQGQSGKSLTVAQAAQLILSATNAKAALGCS